MKTYKNLYQKICSFENLLLAFYKARRGKRKKENVADFEYHLEDNIFKLQEELTNQTYQPGNYRNFYVYEGKRRKISE